MVKSILPRAEVSVQSILGNARKFNVFVRLQSELRVFSFYSNADPCVWRL